MVDEASYTALGDRFRALWSRCLPPEVKMDVIPVYDDLVRRYNEPDRRYHGWAHLTHCLREFDRAAVQMEIPDAVELALWFHDAVYVPCARDNEQRSADLFRSMGQKRVSPGVRRESMRPHSDHHAQAVPPMKATSPPWWISICRVSGRIGRIFYGTR